MEWDQIADKWTAMTRRLRNDRIGVPRNNGGLPDARRATRGIDRKLSDKQPPKTVDIDRNPPSSQ